jgi:hypothetical protein
VVGSRVRGQELDLDIFRLAGFAGFSRVAAASPLFIRRICRRCAQHIIAHYVVRPWIVLQINALIPIIILIANDSLLKVSTPQAELTYLELLGIGKIASHRLLIIDALMQMCAV